LKDEKRGFCFPNKRNLQWQTSEQFDGLYFDFLMMKRFLFSIKIFFLLRQNKVQGEKNTKNNKIMLKKFYQVKKLFFWIKSFLGKQTFFSQFFLSFSGRKFFSYFFSSQENKFFCH